MVMLKMGGLVNSGVRCVYICLIDCKPSVGAASSGSDNEASINNYKYPVTDEESTYHPASQKELNSRENLHNLGQGAELKYEDKLPFVYQGKKARRVNNKENTR